MSDILNKLRSFMKSEGLDFLIVSSSDEFLNEYTDLNENSRYILTGFSGSTGDALVTEDKAFLFVDGRYHLQAENEVDNSIITVVKLDMKTSIRKGITDKVLELAKNGQTLGIVSSKMSYSSYKSLAESFKEKNIKIVELFEDPVSVISGCFLEKPSTVRHIPIKLTGKSSKEKIGVLTAELKAQDIDAFVVTKLEEIAYVSNMRGSDIQYSATFKSKAVIYNGKCYIFLNSNKEENNECIEFKALNEFDYFISTLKDKNFRIAITPTSVNLKDYRLIEKTNNTIVELDLSPISEMKSIKTKAELEHMKECFTKTDIAVNRAIHWTNQSLDRDEKITEKDFSDKVKQFFFEEGACDLSFEVLAASGKNSAFIHYTHPDPHKIIEPDELILLDCGIYCEGGLATDITRTFLAGGNKVQPSAKIKKVYTTVLKAFLNGLNYPVQEGTTGFDIDYKVRFIIDENIEEGFSFAHGTGHGVGISVHEDPPRLGTSDFSKTPLKDGMCFTIEPGMYCSGWGGVRLENTVSLVREDNELKIRTLVRSKFDENLVDFSMLTEQEKEWFVAYQKRAIG